MKRLQNEHIVVTAAAAGIGRAAAEAFTAEGAVVHALDNDKNRLLEVCAKNTALVPHVLDLLDTQSVRKFAQDIGPVDVLFNCAGFVHNGTILDCTEEDWDSSFRLNIKAMYVLSKALLPSMIARGGGNIINMSSVAGTSKGVPNRFVYSASKAAVVGLTKSIAADFIKQGIRCNAVCPGTVDTPSLRSRLAAFPDAAQARRDFENRQPLGRMGTTEEIAALLVYLAAKESAYTTGQVHIIDGGWSNS